MVGEMTPGGAIFAAAIIFLVLRWMAQPAKPPPPPWYEVNQSTTSIREYKSVVEADRDAARASEHGWRVQSVATSDGHINVGRTYAGAILTGGVTLLLGGSRTSGKVTVTFVRPLSTFA